MLLLRHKNIRNIFCERGIFCSSARRDRGAVTQVTEGLIDIPTYGAIHQPPRLAATPPIFSVRKTQKEKKLPYPTKKVLPPHVVVTPHTWGGNTLPYYIPRLILMIAI